MKITPFVEKQTADGVISYGLGSYGYDVRCGYRFKVFTNTNCAEADPKALDGGGFVDVDLTPDPARPGRPNFVRIPPNSFALAETVECVEIPRDVLAVVANKSTYARAGIACPSTVLEPEWRGWITLEVANTTPLPARVYAGEGIAQILFFRTDGTRERLHKIVAGLLESTGFPHVARNLNDWDVDGACRVSYADRKGRYQGQTGLTTPFVRPPAAAPEDA